MRKLVIARRAAQVLFFSLFVYVLWSTTYPLKGQMAPQLLFKLDPLIMFVTAVSQKVILPGLIWAVGMTALTLLLGRFFCGWVCPMGTIIDWVGAAGRKLRRPILAERQRLALSVPKFVILGLVLILAFVGIQAAWVFDPIVTVARVVSLDIIPAVTVTLDRFLQFCIQRFGLYDSFYDFYRYLKEGLLGVNVHFFANSLITLLWFLAVSGGALLILRLWCRMLCPLGAWYAMNARPAWLQRRADGCNSCGACVRKCRMGAIKDGADYRKGECILCMDCVYDCPQTVVSFTGSRKTLTCPEKERPVAGKGITRGQFLLCLAALVPSWGFRSKDLIALTSDASAPVIRPPGASPESRFVNTCVRCGNCMKVCITNGLQPVMLESGWEGLWTPQLLPEVGYCEYNCTLCGEVCPTGAIPSLNVQDKHRASLGLAVIDRAVCLAWDGKKECLVCEEHCPVAEKAIINKAEIVDGRTILRPYVDTDRCIGCGICQNKCPTRPMRAIRVDPGLRRKVRL
ncbi:MAG: 4Fe-4S binding protein [Candidatus Omnitrophica bacterium]|nr:4Fe-4S binding protein [Candidatus Omnitrophota bacterium]